MRDRKGSKRCVQLQPQICSPYYDCLAKFRLVSHWLVYIWKHRMPGIAKSVHTNDKWNATPVYYLTTLMEPNSIGCTKEKYTENYQNCCNHPTSCKVDDRNSDTWTISWTQWRRDRTSLQHLKGMRSHGDPSTKQLAEQRGQLEFQTSA